MNVVSSSRTFLLVFVCTILVALFQVLFINFSLNLLLFFGLFYLFFRLHCLPFSHALFFKIFFAAIFYRFFNVLFISFIFLFLNLFPRMSGFALFNYIDPSLIPSSYFDDNYSNIFRGKLIYDSIF